MEGEVSRVKRVRKLSPNQTQNIVMDSDSEEEAYYTSTDTEDEQQPRPPSPISKHASRDYSASSSEDEEVVDNVAGRQPQPSQWTLPPEPRRHVVHTFIGAPTGKSSEAATITTASTPLSVLLLFFAEIITLLVVETNRYYQHFLDSSNKKPPPQHDVTEAKMFAFLAMTLQMGHTFQHRLDDYWTKMEQLSTPFYGQRMSRIRYFHILHFLHFTDNDRNEVHRTDDRLENTRFV
jgi:hypothetical protein